MSGEWIKVELNTPDKPEVFKMSRILKCDRDLVFGKLIRLWAWFDRNSVDGVVDGMVSTDVDAVVLMPGFFEALKSVGWGDSDDEEGVIWLVNFGHHNGETAKKRALKNKRQARYRAGLKDDDEHVDTTASTEASTREEKRREDNNIDKKSDSKPKGKAKKTKTPIDPNLELSPEWRKRALEHWAANDRQDLNPDAEFFNFKNYQIANANTSACWASSWATWYGNAIKFGSKPNQARPTDPAPFQLKRLGGDL